MMQAESKPANLEPRCRLCLQCIQIDDGLDRYVDIFAENETLSLKIRDCVGVFVSPEDSIRTVCTNCQQTICLIDDFRTLCRQAEEIYESVKIDCKDGNNWGRYREHVDELRLLVQQHKDVINEHMVEYEVGLEGAEKNSISNAFAPIVEVKEELDYDVEWEPGPMIEEFLEIKPNINSGLLKEEQKNDDSSDENGSGYDEYSRRLSIGTKLAIAEEIKKNQIIWDTSLASSAKMIEKTWKTIASKFEMDEKVIKNHWRQLQGFYRINRNRKPNNSQSNVKFCKLMEVLHYMRGQDSDEDNSDESDTGQRKSGKDEESPRSARCRKSCDNSVTSSRRRRKLTKMIYDNEILWNRKHADFPSNALKDDVWDSIAKEMNVTRDKVKYGWKCLRDLYRGRIKRVIRGQLNRDAQILQDPLFKMLDEMCADNMRIGSTPTVSIKTLIQHESDSNDADDAVVENDRNENPIPNESAEESEDELEGGTDIKQEIESNSNYEFQITFAQEVLTLLKNDSSTSSCLWEQAGVNLELDSDTAKAHWNEMRQTYMDNMNRLSNASLLTRLKLHSCSLFILMNLIVPKLEGFEPYIVPLGEDSINERKKLPIDIRVPLVMEIKKYPEIWNPAMSSSSHMVELIWRNIGDKFLMDLDVVRYHYKALQGLLRSHRRRERNGLNIRSNADKRYRKLIQMLRSMRSKAGNQDEDEAPDRQNDDLEEEDAVEDTPVKSKPKTKSKQLSGAAFTRDTQRIALARFVYKHPYLWDKKHADFNNCILKDKKWDVIAARMEVTRDEIKYAWKCLRDLYRSRLKRVISGKLSTTAPLLRDPLFKLLDVMCSDNMKIGSTPVAIKSLLSHESESNDIMDESTEEGFVVPTCIIEEPDVESDEEIEYEIDIKQEQIEPTARPSSSNYDLHVTFAQLVLELINQNTSSSTSSACLWKKAGEILELDPATAKARWNVMKQNYMDNRTRLIKGDLMTRLRLDKCSLFNLMNQIVPILEDLEPYVAPPEEINLVERRKLPIGLKIAIATEVQKYPEIWNPTLACSSNKAETIWNIIGVKFEMDKDIVRNHFKTMQGLLRNHRRRESEGLIVEANVDKKYRKLIEILESMSVRNSDQNEATNEEEHQDDSEEDRATVGSRKMPNKAIGMACTSSSKRMQLAQFVHRHEYLWNQKHPDFGNCVLKDQKWDVIAARMKITREEVKYAWKCLRDLYRGRMKRVFSGKLATTAPLLRDPLFKLLDEMCTDNMKFGSHLAITSAKSQIVEHEKELESNEALEDNDEFSVKFDKAVKLKLISLVEQHSILWDSEHAEHLNLEKRDQIWETIAEQMNFTKATVKALWTRLRNVYRGRTLRSMKGLMRQNNPLLREPVYVRLRALLDGHMQLGKFSAKAIAKPLCYQKRKEKEVNLDIESGPFPTLEAKVQFVQEVIKHELLWNSSHADYFKSEMRGAAWTQIAGMFENCEVNDAKSMWRRLRNKHRPRRPRNVFKNMAHTFNNDDEEELNEEIKDPLYELFSKMAESLTGGSAFGDPTIDGVDGEPSQKRPRVAKRRLQEVTEAFMTHKRRFTGKKFFDDEGCIKVKKGGTVRYEKICELCGKSIERSLFEYHMNQHNGIRPYECAFEGCGKQYSNKITRDRHEILIHHEDNYKYNCDQCDERFKYRSTFDYHYAVKHESQMVPCPVCGKLLKHKSLIREHVRRHTGHFPCPVCGKILQKKYSLDVHMRTHTNVKPYACDMCGQRFMLKVQLKTHLAKVHQMEWEVFVATYGDKNGQP
ncbi:uncharacterized protein LOC134205837 [Armigeres subalbatus]|uniref:uncharacterized protein LOC134205837 n=1 Tax=Armigeres subalbatus TaxID=124917 RepID=UPI002ED3159E